MADGTEVPERISRLIDFVNTYDADDGTDEFVTPDSLSRWLVTHDLLAGEEPAASEDDLVQAREFREALRVVMTRHHDDASAANESLDQLARELPLRLSFAGPQPTLYPVGTGTQAALGRLLVTVVEAAGAGSWTRLKVCPADTCRWAFYDTSKNRSRTWCSMDVCGNRAKTRRYRSRRKAATAASS